MTTIAESRSLGLLAATPLPQASVRMAGLRLAYGKQTVLDALDWQVLPGQVVGLLGRNGAGKTSLLESLLGLRDPGAGTVELFGQSLASLDDTLRARIGYVPQRSDLFEWLTASQLLDYFRSFYPRWNKAKVDGLVSRWAIPTDKPIGKLSTGEQQRLSIIRALAHEPDLLVLDEPVASLDPAGRRDFLRELVEQVIGRGTTVVFSTHILSDLERVAFHVAFLHDGRIVLEAALDELMESCRLLAGTVEQLRPVMQFDGISRLAVRALPGGRVCWLVRSRKAPQWPPGIEQRAPNLEDLFMELTQ